MQISYKNVAFTGTPQKRQSVETSVILGTAVGGVDLISNEISIRNTQKRLQKALEADQLSSFVAKSRQNAILRSIGAGAVAAGIGFILTKLSGNERKE